MFWLERLRELKQRSGISTKELAEAAEVPFGTLNNILAGNVKSPQLETMRRIVYTLGYTLDDLDPGRVENDGELLAYLGALRTRPEMKMLFRVSKNATKKEVEAAVKIIEALVQKDT